MCYNATGPNLEMTAFWGDEGLFASDFQANTRARAREKIGWRYCTATFQPAMRGRKVEMYWRVFFWSSTRFLEWKNKKWFAVTEEQRKRSTVWEARKSQWVARCKCMWCNDTCFQCLNGILNAIQLQSCKARTLWPSMTSAFIYSSCHVQWVSQSY